MEYIFRSRFVKGVVVATFLYLTSVYSYDYLQEQNRNLREINQSLKHEKTVLKQRIKGLELEVNEMSLQDSTLLRLSSESLNDGEAVFHIINPYWSIRFGAAAIQKEILEQIKSDSLRVNDKFVYTNPR